MSKNKPSIIKRGSILLMIFFTVFFSIITNAQATDSTEFNAANITIQLDAINQTILNKNNNYEGLTQALHEINTLQRQITLCIKSGQTRLDKISHLLDTKELSGIFMHDKQSWNYLLKEKDIKLTQVESCSFLNYKLEEIRDIATNQINKVSKYRLFEKTPISYNINAALFSNSHFSLNALYQHSGIKQLIINALALYMLTIFVIKLCFMIGIKKTQSSITMTIFQTSIFLISLVYMLTVETVLTHHISVSLEFVDFIDITYVVVILRLIVACVSGFKQWMPENLVVKIQKRLFIIATLILSGYIFAIILGTQPISPDLFTLLDSIYITLLNIAYFWLVSLFLDPLITRNYHKTAQITLGIICLSNIIVAWCGYQYFAIAFVTDLIVTIIVLIIILDVNTFIKRIYFLLSEPNQILSQKLRYVLGINTDKKLVELYIMRLSLVLPITLLCTLCILEIWGVTRYQVFNLLMKLHGGVSIFGIIIEPILVLRAGFIFCAILLAGRMLATLIVRKNMSEEDKHTQIMVHSLIHYFSFTIGLLIALFIAGVNLKSLVFVAGALSVGLGFGLQSFAKDFISGLVILINKPIKIGDHIEVGDRNKNEGIIKKIGAFSTQLHTLSYSDVIIPNSEMITRSFTNFTFHNNALSRINISIKLDKSDDLELAKHLLLDIASKNSNVLQKPPYEPIVLCDLYELTLWCVINDVNHKERVLSELNFSIGYAFNDRE